MALLPSVASPMHGAVVPIAYYKVTASGGDYSIDFQNIPSVYQDLQIIMFGRSTQSVSQGDCYLQLNNDTGTNYSRTLLTGNGSSASSSRSSNDGSAYPFYMPGASATSGIFGSAILHILNYANTSTYKTLLGRWAADLNGSGGTQELATLWRSTAAINRLTFTVGNWAQNSTVALYGIRTVGQ